MRSSSYSRLHSRPSDRYIWVVRGVGQFGNVTLLGGIELIAKILLFDGFSHERDSSAIGYGGRRCRFAVPPPLFLYVQEEIALDKAGRLDLRLAKSCLVPTQHRRLVSYEQDGFSTFCEVRIAAPPASGFFHFRLAVHMIATCGCRRKSNIFILLPTDTW
jgi:hypothetical protein